MQALAEKRGSRFKDRAGQRFGSLVVLALYGFSKTRKHSFWKCRCDCGIQINVSANSLVSSNTKSCGCTKNARISEANTTHGHTRNQKSPEYITWLSLRSRCRNTKDKNWPDYGKRGIRVCQRWINSFVNFYHDMGRRPSPTHSIERKKNSGNYTPTNCKWATPKEQGCNKRNNVWLTLGERTEIMSEWSRITGIRRLTLRRRKQLGWTDEQAITTPLRGKA